MTTPYSTPASFRKALEARLQGHSERTGEDINRLRRKVAFDKIGVRPVNQSIFMQHRDIQPHL